MANNGVGVTPKKMASAMTVIDEVVSAMVMQKVAEIGAEAIKTDIQKEVLDFIKETYGEVKHTAKITTDAGSTIEIDGLIHEKFETVLAFARNDEPVYLTGAAGCGKSVICEQIATTMGLPFYYSSSVTQEYKITGFTDANGHYNASPFYHAFTKGGVFMLDELDASIPEVLILLNGAIANKEFDFPAPIGNVKAHPDFRIIAAGNTCGQGASYEYNGRNQLDGATLDRFAIVNVKYDERIEWAISNGNRELLDFIYDFRRAVATAGANVITSYRAVKRMAKMEDVLGLNEMMDTCLIRGMDVDTVTRIYSNLSNKSNKYARAFKEVGGVQ